MLHTDKGTVSVSCRETGSHMGIPLFVIRLQNSAVTIELTNLGATIMAVLAPDRKGNIKNVVAGFDNAEAYANNPWYFGSTVGRFANRIGGGKFTLNGETVQLTVNNHGNHLHGGLEGFHRKMWPIVSLIEKPAQCGVEMEYHSVDGEEGYPGNLHVKVKFLLNRDNQLEIVYNAVTDQSTPVNLTNHSYFNLSGFEVPVIKDHVLQINADAYTPKGANNLPDGRLLPVAGSPLDFLLPTPVGTHLHTFAADMGYDHNFVLNHGDKRELILAARLKDPYSGRTLQVFTDQPGMQVYTSNYWDGSITGQQHMPYVKHGAIALETQAFPDSPNQPGFPDTILRPGQQFHSVTIYEFGLV